MEPEDDKKKSDETKKLAKDKDANW